MKHEQQIILQTTEKSLVSCAFTGHRDLGKDFSLKETSKEIEKLILRGVTDFYNGMAMGFDLYAAEAVLKLKKKYPQIKLIACIPFIGQESRFSDRDKRRYAKVYKAADEKVVLFPRYYNGCFLARDRFMADKADSLVTYCRKETGGTAYTVRYFQKKKPQCRILFI